MVAVLNAVEVAYCGRWCLDSDSCEMCGIQKLPEVVSKLVHANWKQNCFSAKQMLCNLVRASHDTACSCTCWHNPVGPCTCWPWYHMLLYVLAMMLCAVLHAGQEAVCYGTCWLLWYCIHLNMLVMMLCFLVMCLPQYCILLYLLTTILYTLVCACHDTMHSCTC